MNKQTNAIPQWLLDLEQRAKSAVNDDKLYILTKEDVPRLVEALKQSFVVMDKLERKAVKLQDSQLCDKVRLEVTQYRKKFGDRRAKV